MYQVNEKKPPATCDLDDLLLFIPAYGGIGGNWVFGQYDSDKGRYTKLITIGERSQFVEVEPTYWTEAPNTPKEHCGVRVLK